MVIKYSVFDLNKNTVNVRLEMKHEFLLKAVVVLSTRRERSLIVLMDSRIIFFGFLP